MAKRRRKTASSRDMLTLAGWLFADLLLGLAMFFLVISPAPPAIPTPTVTHTPTSSPSPAPSSVFTTTPLPTDTPTPFLTPTPMPTFTPLPTLTPWPTFTPFPTYTPFPTPTGVTEPGIESTSVCYRIQVNRDALFGASSVDEQNRILGELRNFIIASSDFRPGTVLIWGSGHDNQDGVNIASEIRSLLLVHYRPQFEDSGIKALFFSSENIGTVVIEIYFFTGSRHAQGTACTIGS